jgi:hypothetical protein
MSRRVLAGLTFTCLLVTACRGRAPDRDVATASLATDPTLVTFIERVAERRPRCQAIRGLTARGVYEAIVGMIAENVDATPWPVNDDVVAERAGRCSCGRLRQGTSVITA